jgi:hypothetical protein
MSDKVIDIKSSKEAMEFRFVNRKIQEGYENMKHYCKVNMVI